MLDTKQLGAGNTLGKTVQPESVHQLHLLLVESNVAGFADRSRTLLERHYCLTTAKDVRDLFFLRERAPFAVVVLSASIGPAALVEAARSVRRQWPLARIVIVGQAAPVLEDHLYDETVSLSCQPQELVDVLAQVTFDPWTRPAGGRPFVVQTPGSVATPAPSLRAEVAPETRIAGSIAGLSRLPA